MVITDTLTRLVEEVITADSLIDESFENGLLEYPQYTRPEHYNGQDVPEVLLSGHHEKIRLWRLKQSLKLTREKRPDLLTGREFTDEEKKIMAEIEAEETTTV